MLSQRKRYNYLGPNTSQVGRSHRRQSSSYKQSEKQNLKVQPIDLFKSTQAKRILQLEQTNQKMLEETTKQFQKFEADVFRVEGILRIKDAQVQRLQSGHQELLEDKQALTQALHQKQEIIKQFHQKLKQLIAQKQRRRVNKKCESTQTNLSPFYSSAQTQTQDIEQQSNQRIVSTEQLQQIKQEQLMYQSKYQQILDYKGVLQQSIYSLRRELCNSNQQLSNVKLQLSQFQALNCKQQHSN